MKKLWIVVSVCLLVAACSSHKVPVVPSYQQIPVIQVQKDDTLYSLAKRYDTSVQELISKNKIADPTALQPGQDLTLPHPITVPVHYAEKMRSGENVGSEQTQKSNSLQTPKTQVDTQKSSVKTVAKQTFKTTEQKKMVSQSTDKSEKKGVSQAKTSQKLVSNTKTTSKTVKSGVKTKKLDKPFVATGKISFDWPVKGKILSGFGSKGGGVKNDGINISAKLGTAIKAAEAGIVVYAGNELKGYGNLLLLRHEKGYMTAYAHADKIYVETGQVVAKGDKIATVGTTGNVKTPQLHFEIRKKTKSVDPKKYLH